MSYIGNKPADTIATSADISDGAITAAKLATASVTQPKINGSVAGTGPAFSAIQTAGQSFSSSTTTKIAFNSEEWDTANCYDPTTNYRFTPNVAGYYQISAAVGMNATGGLTGLIFIYKNGSAYRRGTQTSSAGSTYDATVSSLIYFNGTTDYVEGYMYLTGTSPSTSTDSTSNWFTGVLVRSA